MHGAGLMQSVKTNLKQLNSYYRAKTIIKSSRKPVKTEYNFPEVSEKELEKIKNKFQQKIKKEKQRDAILAVCLTILFFWLAYFLLIK